MTTLMHSSHPITPRRPAFDFAATPSHWIYDDPLATHMLNVINPITPAPERWFCQTIREALPYVTDPNLRQAALAFIKQEGAHSASHTLGNRQIEQLGIDLRPYTDLLDWLFSRMLGHDPLGMRLHSPRAKRAWLDTRLAMVAAAEHLTGVLGHWVLNATALEQAPVDSEMLRLLLRSGAALVTFPLFAVLAERGIRYLVRHDPALPHRLRITDYLRAARSGRVPAPGCLLRAALRYFAPSHSPLTEGNTAQALAYLARMDSSLGLS